MQKMKTSQGVFISIFKNHNSSISSHLARLKRRILDRLVGFNLGQGNGSRWDVGAVEEEGSLDSGMNHHVDFRIDREEGAGDGAVLKQRRETTVTTIVTGFSDTDPRNVNQEVEAYCGTNEAQNRQ